VSHVEALVFDVFGTLVDWRTSLTANLSAFGDERGLVRAGRHLARRVRALDGARACGAVELLATRPERVMMVAAHNGDLRAAAALGLRTQRTDLAADEGIDLAVRDLGELADRLEA
jgi:2-haloacid dehalogenase